MKYEWRKKERELYLPKAEPTLVEVPKFKYFTITGKGNPNNNPDFQARIKILYSLAYTIRMMPKGGIVPTGYFEYTVYPLEGVWEISDEGKKEKEFSKDYLVYKLMIRQPNFVNKELFEKAIRLNKDSKNPSPLLDEVKFEEIEDGLCVQMLHIGSYDDEFQTTYKEMGHFIENNKYKRLSKKHKEIYLKFSDDKSKLRTVIRFFVSK
jgi:hypothetical protein